MYVRMYAFVCLSLRRCCWQVDRCCCWALSPSATPHDHDVLERQNNAGAAKRENAWQHRKPTYIHFPLPFASSASSYPAPLPFLYQTSTLHSIYIPHLPRTSTRLHTSKLDGSLENPAPPHLHHALLPVASPQTTAFSIICPPAPLILSFRVPWNYIVSQVVTAVKAHDVGDVLLGYFIVKTTRITLYTSGISWSLSSFGMTTTPPSIQSSVAFRNFRLTAMTRNF